ncbi:MAG: thermonuclease family protein [Chloroflexota bacterium]
MNDAHSSALSRGYAWYKQRGNGVQVTVALIVLGLICAPLFILSALIAAITDDEPVTAPATPTAIESGSLRDDDPTATLTATEEPTETRVAPTATERPDPSATPTEEAVATPEPVADTPEPTSTSEPTATAEPTATDPPTPTPEPLGEEVEVIRVIDGDTIEVLYNGRAESVRLIGIDTPETVHPSQPVQCYGPEASQFTLDMIARANFRVILERDVSERDQFGRLLRYVWLPHSDGLRFLNEELVGQGYAMVTTYPPDVAYTNLFLERQRAARNNGLGLWGACGDFGVPLATPTPEPAPAPPPSGGNCDPSYPDVCIPPYPPDLNCDDVPYRRFTVLPPDPHGFDGDNDGIGCESG